MGITNVCIFVADALRWDFLPDAIRSQGTVLKGVASSTISPTSFASICSGQYFHSHGVYSFADQLEPDDNRLLALDGYETSFWETYDDDDPIYSVLDQDPAEKRHLGEIEPPFVYIEREVSTHSPYGYREADETDESATEFIIDRITDRSELVESYRAGVSRCVAEFEARLETLRERDLLDETLVILLADHGEILGEYAEWAHTLPVVPELVYVPVVVLHPDGREPETDGVVSHIDVVPTVYDALGEPIPETVAGQSVFGGSPRDYAYCGIHLPANESVFGPSENPFHTYRQTIDSVWDHDGGWVFDSLSPRGRALSLLKSGRLWSRKRRRGIRANPTGWLRLLHMQLKSSVQFGAPVVGKDEARGEVESVYNRKDEKDRAAVELSADQEERLEDLGYL